MTWGAVAIGGGAIIGGYMASEATKSAGRDAAGSQGAASTAQIAQSKEQFEKIQALLSPYVKAGTGALGAQQNLLGLGGPEAQKSAIAGLEGSPQFQAMMQQGENSILQNASATGGLRGGDIQGALSQFRPQLLSQLIQQQYANLGGLTSVGQNAAAGVGNAGMQTGLQINNALGQQGAAQAGAALATGQANSQMWGGIGQTASTLGTLKLLKAF